MSQFTKCILYSRAFVWAMYDGLASHIWSVARHSGLHPYWVTSVGPRHHISGAWG